MLKFFTFVFLAIGLTSVSLAEYFLYIDTFEDPSSIESVKVGFIDSSGGLQNVDTTGTPSNDPYRLKNQSFQINITPKSGYENPSFELKVAGYETLIKQVYPTAGSPYSVNFSVPAVRITGLKADLIKRTATFDQNYYDGSGNLVVERRQVSYGHPYGQLPTVTRTGYTFGGWWSTRDESGGTEVTANVVFEGTSDISLYARWTPETYEVTLHTQGGTLVGWENYWEKLTNDTYRLTYTYGESIVGMLPTPTHPNNLTFGGWYENKSCEGNSVTTFPVHKTVTYYAKWNEPKELKFDVNLVASDSLSVSMKEAGTCNVAYTLPEFPENFDKTGYWGDSWNTRKDLCGVSYKVGSTITRSEQATLYLYAEWQPCTYLLTFTGGDGQEKMESIRAVYDNPTNLPACGFTQTSCRFTGWQTRTNNIPVVYSAGAEVMNMTTERKNQNGASESNLVDVVFAAQWETNWVSFHLHQDARSFKFQPPQNFPTEDGNRVAYAVGRSWGSLPTVGFTDNRYTFVNWYYVQDGQTNTVTATNSVLDGVTELHASWLFNDPLAQALDADGKLEFVSKVLTSSQTETQWTVDSTTADFGQSSVVISVPQEDRQKTVAVALETSVVGPGTLSFAWRMRMERILGTTSDTLKPTDWQHTAERLMFGVGDGFGSGGGKPNMKEGFKYGLAATDSKILIVTDPEDTVTKPVSWGGGWTNMSVKIEAEADKTNVVRWIHYSEDGFQEWAATGWVDHVVWTPAGSDIVLPKTDTGLHTDITVPADWPDQYPTFADKYGSDLAAALVKPTGKKTADGSPMYVWQDYVIGTDPTDPADRLTASIEMGADGQPIIKWSPDLRTATPKRVYTVYGASTLDGEWMSVTDENRAQMRFFKVGVDVE